MQPCRLAPADIVAVVARPGASVGLAQIGILIAIAHGVKLRAGLLGLRHALLYEVVQHLLIVVAALLGNIRILVDIIVVVVDRRIIQAVARIVGHIALALCAAGSMQPCRLAPADIMAVVARPGASVGLAQIGILIAIAHGVKLRAGLLGLRHALLNKVVQDLLIVIITLLGHIRILLDIIVVVVDRRVIQSVTRIVGRIALQLCAAGSMQPCRLAPADIMAVVARPGSSVGLTQIGILIAIAHGIKLRAGLLGLRHALLHEIVQHLLVIIAELLVQAGILCNIIVVIVDRCVVQSVACIAGRIALALCAAGSVQA